MWRSKGRCSLRLVKEPPSLPFWARRQPFKGGFQHLPYRRSATVPSESGFPCKIEPCRHVWFTFSLQIIQFFCVEPRSAMVIPNYMLPLPALSTRFFVQKVGGKRPPLRFLPGPAFLDSPKGGAPMAGPLSSCFVLPTTAPTRQPSYIRIASVHVPFRRRY
jgi:hypothetical protein